MVPSAANARETRRCTGNVYIRDNRYVSDGKDAFVEYLEETLAPCFERGACPEIRVLRGPETQFIP